VLMVFLLIGTAAAFDYVMPILRLPDMITQGFLEISRTSWVILLPDADHLPSAVHHVAARIPHDRPYFKKSSRTGLKASTTRTCGVRVCTACGTPDGTVRKGLTARRGID
jgi:hypothetical protein